MAALFDQLPRNVESLPMPSVLQTASKLALSRQSHASPAPTLRKFKIRLLYAIAALALRLSALRLVRRPPPARLTRHLAMAKRDASDFDEAAATRDAKKLKVAELRAALEAAGADTKGLKAELVSASSPRSATGPPSRRPVAAAGQEAKSPAKPQPDGQKIEIVRLDARAPFKRRRGAPVLRRAAAFGKLRHATTLDDGGSLELGSAASPSSRPMTRRRRSPPKKKAPAGRSRGRPAP